MTAALWLFFVQGLIGAFDTIYYHEWRARLPARGRQAAPELRVHAVRDFLYAILFGTLPWFAWQGVLVWVLAAIFLAEIALTMTDFVIEIQVRKSIGDVFAGERVTHGVMGVIYGAAIANLVPEIISWHSRPTAFALSSTDAPLALRIVLTAAGIGVFLSGLRDLYASYDLPHCHWPWEKIRPDKANALSNDDAHDLPGKVGRI